MPVAKSEVRRAVGKLVSAIQKEWGKEIGEPGTVVSEEVMHNCHALLAAKTAEDALEILAGRTVTEFLGVHWVRAHPSVLPHISRLDSLL
jgi:hypothetical protein